MENKDWTKTEGTGRNSELYPGDPGFSQLPEIVHSFDLYEDEADLASLIDDIFDWGLARGITRANGASALSQITKLREEIEELEEAIKTGDWDKAKDGIGDSFVVLIQICRLSGIRLDDSLGAAWNDIKDRKGQMFCGVFVKQADLNLVSKNLDIIDLHKAKSAEEVKDIIEAAREKGA